MERMDCLQRDHIQFFVKVKNIVKYSNISADFFTSNVIAQSVIPLGSGIKTNEMRSASGSLYSVPSRVWTASPTYVLS